MQYVNVGRTIDDTFAAGLRQALAAYHLETRGEVNEILAGGDLACCRAVLDVKLFVRGSGELARRHQRGNVLSVFRREADGQWRLARDANLILPVRE